MQNDSQKEAFSSYEADEYFLRNQKILKEYSADKDPVMKILDEYNCIPKNILEIGCNGGYRLNAINERFPYSKVCGIEPSQKAIEYGKMQYPKIDFYQGTADNLSIFEASTFDFVIIGFVLYVVDRDLLFKTISEIDRVLINGGILINIDFFARVPHKNEYSHIKNQNAFSFKQNYDEIFTSSRLYQLLDKRSVNHSSKKYDITNDYYDKYVVSTLRKDMLLGY